MPARIYSYTVVFTPAEEGGYSVSVPALPGCFTQGETLEEARTMAREAIQGHLEALAETGGAIPVEKGEPVIPRAEKIEIAVHLA